MSHGMEGRSCSNRFLLWLLLLTLWTYATFYVQYLYPRSVRKDDNEAFLDYVRIGKPDDHGNNSESEENNENSLRIAKRGRNSTTYGLILGPFGSTEDRILDKRSTGSCDKRGWFARIVWSRKFVLVFHELTMTGAPLSMMELATELLSCEAIVSVVVLSKKGGLMPELVRRKIKVVEDNAIVSFKTAAKADLVIAGSAVCSSWIGECIFCVSLIFNMLRTVSV